MFKLFVVARPIEARRQFLTPFRDAGAASALSLLNVHERPLMTSSTAEEKNPFRRKEGLEYAEDNELDDNLEDRGLLSDGHEQHVDENTQARSTFYEEDVHEGRAWSTTRMTYVGAAMILLLLGASFARPFLRSGAATTWKEHPNSKFVGGELRSNGTTEFKRTVIIVSIDGLRYVSLHVVCCDTLL